MADGAHPFADGLLPAKINDDDENTSGKKSASTLSTPQTKNTLQWSCWSVIRAVYAEVVRVFIMQKRGILWKRYTGYEPWINGRYLCCLDDEDECSSPVNLLYITSGPWFEQDR